MPARGDLALDALHEVEHRQQAGARLRVAGGDLLSSAYVVGSSGLLAHLGRRDGGGVGAVVDPGIRPSRHRSTPPITGSIEAMATMTSATMPPSLITEVAWRLVNDGSRKADKVPPSPTISTPL